MVKILKDCCWLTSIFLGISLMWIGAEHVFEGVVHTSYIDSVVCMILSFFVFKEFDEFVGGTNDR